MPTMMHTNQWLTQQLADINTPPVTVTFDRSSRNTVPLFVLCSDIWVLCADVYCHIIVTCTLCMYVALISSVIHARLTLLGVLTCVGTVVL